MTDEEWAGWLRTPWVVVAELRDIPADDEDAPVGWVIVKKQDLRSHVADDLGPVYQDEETARHVVRCHNWWLAGMTPETLGEALHGDPEPSQSRAPES